MVKRELMSMLDMLGYIFLSNFAFNSPQITKLNQNKA